MTSSIKEARRIARHLVTERQTACVNILPKVESVYRWQGKIESAGEFMLIAKTTHERSEAVCAVIRELHSYELPECVVLEIAGGSADYLRWIGENSRPEPRGE